MLILPKILSCKVHEDLSNRILRALICAFSILIFPSSLAVAHVCVQDWDSCLRILIVHYDLVMYHLKKQVITIR